MALVNSAFTVNVTPGAMPPIVHVSEYDIGRTYTVTINGQNGGVFVIPTGATATIEGTLNGEIGFSTTATIANNTVTFALTESMTARSGKAWCKIKLTLNDEPIQTCAFILDVDRAGVEAETVIGASGFEQQIVDAVQDWLDDHPPSSGGLSDDAKQALLNLFNAIQVGWNVDNARELIAELEAALYPPVDVLSISAVFTQGSAVIFNTDSLDTLKQYLVVTATMTDSTIRTLDDSDYTLSGTLAVGTSTITVSYGGKTTTFDVTVSYTSLLLNDILTLDGIKNTRNGHDSSATTWEDLSGNNHDFAKLSSANSVVWGDDHAIFNATNRILQLNGSDLFGGLTEFSVEFVASISGNGSTDVSGTKRGEIFIGGKIGGHNFRLDTVDTTAFRAQVYTSAKDFSTEQNKISHYVVSCTATEAKLYKDGALVDTATVSLPISSKTVYNIGGNVDGSTTNWLVNANLYKFGISSRALTAQEVANRYAACKSRFGF